MGNLKARNASTVLGLLWWVLNPLLLGAVYGLVFGVLFPREVRGDEPSYIAYLLSGMFPFYFTRSAMVGGVNSIVSNTRLLANLHFPRLVLPLAALLESWIGFIASLFTFFLIVGPIDGIWPGTDIWWLIPAMAIHTVFNFGLSTLVARVAVPFRDLNNLVPYFVRLWLYLSPIIYPVEFFENAPDFVGVLLRANPLFSMLNMYRGGLLGSPVSSSDVFTATAWAIGVAVVGVISFVKYEGKMARYL
jgi:teichoic acid transport system permease protein